MSSVAVGVDLSVELFTALAIFVRVGATLQSMVLFSMRSVPIPVRVGLAVLLAALIQPTLDVDPAVVTWEPVGLAVALGGEILLGLFLGTATKVLMAFIEVAGTLIGVNAGLAVAMQFDPVTQGQALVVTRLVQVAGMLVFLTADLHHEVIEGLVTTFYVAPPGTGVPVAVAGPAISEEFAGLFVAAVRISMPVIGAVMFLNVVAALVTRFAQQMNVYFSVGLSLNAAIGLMVGAFTLPAVAETVIAVGRMLGPLMRDVAGG